MILDKEFPPDERVENEALILLEGGHEVYILCYDYSRSRSKIENYRGIVIQRIPTSKILIRRLRIFQHPSLNLYRYFWEYKVKKFVVHNHIDVLHIHDLYMVPSGIKARRYIGIQVVVDLHENYPAALKEYTWATTLPGRLIVRPRDWENIEAAYFQNVDRIIVLSQYYQRQLLKKYTFLKDDNITVYPNVPCVKDLLSYKIRKVFDKKDIFIVLYFGVVARRRGIFTVFEALRILSQKIQQEIKLLLIGPIDANERKEFKKYLSDNKTKDQIIHYPWKDIREMPSYITDSDVCLSPILKNDQHESGIANKVFQYMLFARPVIVSDCGPQKELVETIGCGLVHKSNDASDLAVKIHYLQANPELRKTMGEKGRKAVLEIYNTEVQGKQLKELYNSIKVERNINNYDILC
ncbi:MAG TPA: glycosyltransferase family 4 protein [Candidatus Marinimicrobia bacterium]|nr:glycosyltransferase family 4 protein [Candidatus Neomarinimicrobiota bacterium]HRS51072.1 glycosyltransferase family 4 protein [Candidatus Neomarinimicrobiota bacterium]HRU92578.1 glycosyltransferase family 4 protein [Candidatus Neomarinimicrobiota bacterium]